MKVKLSSTIQVDLKDPIIHLYYGPKNLKLAPAYTSFRNLNNEDFVLSRLHHPPLVHVCMGRTHNDVVKDDQNEFFKVVRV